jgi:two-component sensor histidine kinase
VGTVLTGWHCFPGEVSAAEAIVSELVTNAVEASKEEWTVTLRLFAGELSLLVMVWDESGEPPVRRYPGPDEPSGRGLMIVAAMSDAYGAVAGYGGGKVVWARLDRCRL